MPDYPLTMILQCARGTRGSLPVGLVLNWWTEREYERDYGRGDLEPQCKSLEVVWMQRLQIDTAEDFAALRLAMDERRLRVTLDGLDTQTQATLQRRERYDNRGSDGRLRTVKGEVRRNAPVSGGVR